MPSRIVPLITNPLRSITHDLRSTHRDHRDHISARIRPAQTTVPISGQSGSHTRKHRPGERRNGRLHQQRATVMTSSEALTAHNGIDMYRPDPVADGTPISNRLRATPAIFPSPATTQPRAMPCATRPPKLLRRYKNYHAMQTKPASNLASLPKPPDSNSLKLSASKHWSSCLPSVFSTRTDSDHPPPWSPPNRAVSGRGSPAPQVTEISGGSKIDGGHAVRVNNFETVGEKL